MLMAVLALLGGLLLPITGAGAQATGFATADVNMRAGPSTEYPRIIVLPEGGELQVFGCVRGYTWCDVGYFQYRGWVSSRYLSIFYDDYTYQPYRPRVVVPIITFDFGYWDTWYPSYPWYRDYRWRRTYPDWDYYRERRNDDVIIRPPREDRIIRPGRNDSVRIDRDRGGRVVEPGRNDRRITTGGERRDRVDNRRGERVERVDRRRTDRESERNERRREERNRQIERQERRVVPDGGVFGSGQNGLRCAFGDPSCVR
jgi:uncharacterized protein YraI